MKLIAALRIFLLAIAAFGYVANGAQAHLKISGGESLNLMLCSTDSPRTIQLDLPVEPAQEEPDACCGDCTPPAAIAPLGAVQLAPTLFFSQPMAHRLPMSISPGSPLWPGAPPQGPPNSHTHSV